MKLSALTACLATAIAFQSVAAYCQDAPVPIRRSLRVAFYPYVPDKAAMYWKVERQFEAAFPSIDLQYIELGANYYSDGVEESLRNKNVDIVELDTVLLSHLVSHKLIDQLPKSLLPSKNEYLAYAVDASQINGVFYGVPHWVCGNFLFFGKSDPERKRFEACDTLLELEQIIGSPTSPSESLLVDLRGSSTLGEKYFDAVLDKHKTAAIALKFTTVKNIEPDAVKALNRLFRLTPGGLCDSDFHHDNGQFYAREFSRHNARALIGYSERMHYVVDEYLHGIREGKPSRGNNKAQNVGIVSAPLSDSGSTMLSWVDSLVVREGLTDVQTQDAIKLIEFYTSFKTNKGLLIPEWGEAPRYLLPARRALYSDSDVLDGAPLYERFYQIVRKATAITGPALNQNLRLIGAKIENDGFRP